MSGEKRGQKRTSLNSHKIKLQAAGFLLVWVALTSSCHLAPVRVIPSSEVKSIRAEGSFFYRGEAGQGRSRLLYYLQSPDHIRLEIFNPFGGLAYILWLNGAQASLYLPGQKVFWEGDGRKLTAEFLGGAVTASELVCLLSGRKKELTRSQGWHLLGRGPEDFYAGEKGDWKFEIKEFFKGGEIPRTIYFENPEQVVRLRILKIKFNQMFKSDVFDPSYSPAAIKLSWEEITTIWKK